MSNVWALEVEHLVKTYRDAAGRETPVLKDVSFTVAAGEVVAVTGASGSGKSTLLHAAGGLDAFDGGRILIAGPPDFPSSRTFRRNKDIFQEPHGTKN